MKEATGELNMTVIVVVAIAAVAALFYAFIWPSIKKNIQNNTVCANGPGYIQGTQGSDNYVSCGQIVTQNNKKQYTCQYKDADGNLASATCTQK